MLILTHLLHLLSALSFDIYAIAHFCSCKIYPKVKYMTICHNSLTIQLLTAVDWYRSDARMVPRWAVEWYHLGRTDSTAMIRADIEVPTPPAFFRPVVLSGLMIVMAVRKAFCR